MIRRACGGGLAAVSFLWLSGCRGTVPAVNGEPVAAISAVIIGGRLIIPTGETTSGRLWLNLEGEGATSQVYRLPILPNEPLLYQIEPGLYRLSPTRNAFGWHQATLKVRINGHTYRVPFPRTIMRKDPLRAKPRKIVPIGVLVARVLPALPGRRPEVRVDLDDSVDARRGLVQQLVRAMMDPNAPPELRTSAVSWTRALDQTLMEVLAEPERAPLYQSAP